MQSQGETHDFLASAWQDIILIRCWKGSDFIRVDLYNIDGRIIFGELTNYPGVGLDKFHPSSWDMKLGNYWKRQSKDKTKQ